MRPCVAGIYGGSVANSLHAVAEVVAGLHLPNGSVSIPGFYECACQSPQYSQQASLHGVRCSDLHWAVATLVVDIACWRRCRCM